MNKNIFKSIQQSMIESSFIDFYFPENFNHPIVQPIKEYQNNLSVLQNDILHCKNETDLKLIADSIQKQIQNFDNLSKDLPGVNFFFNTVYKNDFNFEKIKSNHEKNYENLSFFKKMTLNIPISIPEQYKPSEAIKKELFDNLHFQYLHLPFKNMSPKKIEQTLSNFIGKNKELMNHLNKDVSSISLYGELGLHLEDKTPVYSHLTKSIGVNPEMTPSSILHEWTHSIDNFIFHKLSGINNYASENLTDFPVKNNAYLPAYKAIKEMLWNVCNVPGEKPSNSHQILGSKHSMYYTHCVVADIDLFVTESDYYKKPCEILARMVENGEFPQHTNELNKGLTNIVYLPEKDNAYLQYKDIIMSSVSKPIHKISTIRELNFSFSNSNPSLKNN